MVYVFKLEDIIRRIHILLKNISTRIHEGWAKTGKNTEKNHLLLVLESRTWLVCFLCLVMEMIE